MIELDRPTLLKTIGRARVYFVPEVEHMSLESCLDETPEGYKRLYERLDSYDLVWFVAKVYVELDGAEIGTSYLGACLYDSYEQFVEQGDYVVDMQSDAIAEAIEFIEQTGDTLTALKNVKKELDA